MTQQRMDLRKEGGSKNEGGRERGDDEREEVDLIQTQLVKTVRAFACSFMLAN